MRSFCAVPTGVVVQGEAAAAKAFWDFPKEFAKDRGAVAAVGFEECRGP